MPLRLAMSGKRRPIIVLIILVFLGIFLFQEIVYSNEYPIKIAIENDPRMLAINPLTNLAVVTHGHSDSVSIIDLNAEKVIKKIHVGRLPKGAAIDTEMNIAVITYQGERSLSLIDLNNFQVTADIHVGDFTGNIAINSRTHVVAVTSVHDHHVFFIDLASRKVIARTYVGSGIGDIAIDPVRNTALILNPDRRKLIMIDMNNYRISDSIDLEKRPQAIDVNPETYTVLITGYRDHSITEIDLLNRRSVVLPVLRYPLDVAFNTIDNRAVILCDWDRKLLLLDLNKNKIIKTYSLPRHPKSVAVNSLRNIAIVADDEKDGLTIIPLPISPNLPKVKITSPRDNAQILSDTVNVSGNVENSSSVTVNDLAATISGNTFSAKLTFKAGKNTISAVATDKYGRTACHNIIVNIVPPATGKITGTVTNTLTGGLLPLAIVSITDAKGATQTIITIISGTFSASVAPGVFSGTIIKPWYLPYSFTGSVTAGETAVMNASLTPADPQISNIRVSEITPHSAKISWTTDQPTEGRVQYGTSTAYGSIASNIVEDTTHSITLTNLAPSTTYHFRVVATSNNGITANASDSTFKTNSQIKITITSPTDGASISGNSAIVTGAIANIANVETGVTVNGIAASLINNQFAVNNVPMTAGQNTIKVTATDTKGTSATQSITVNAAIPNYFIKLTAYPESGTAPVEITLRINGTFSISNPTITYTGPGAVEQLQNGNPDEYKYKINNEGIYYFTVQASGPDGNTYSDTITISVLPLAQVDAMLRAKWSILLNSLSNKDISMALTSMHPKVREKYQTIFTVLKDTMPALIAAQEVLVFKSIEGNRGYYELSVSEDGVQSAYRIVFEKDENGIWLITDF